MSNKFSNTNITQKPPHVCIKPPPGPEYVPPPFLLQPFEGYAEYLDPASPSEGGMISTINLAYMPIADLWYGTAQTDRYKIELFMQTDPLSTWVSFQLRWNVAGVLDAIVNSEKRPPRSWAPFSSGRFDLFPKPATGAAACEVWF